MSWFKQPQRSGLLLVSLIVPVSYLLDSCHVFDYHNYNSTKSHDAVAGVSIAYATRPPANQQLSNQPSATQPALSAWRQATASAGFKGRTSHSSVVFTDPADNREKMWVIGGFGVRNNFWENDVWASADGKAWRQITAAAPFTERGDHSSVVFTDPADNKAKIWVIAGSFAPGVQPGSNMSLTSNKKNDVWASANGKDWRQITAAAPFAPRMHHSSVVFTDPADHKAKIWVLGGFSDWAKNDVWASADGQNWTEMTAATPADKKFPPRYFYGSAVMVDPADKTEKIWLIGGVDLGTDRNNVVWASADGKIWQEIAATTPFRNIGIYSSIVFNNKLWVIGDHSVKSGPNSIYSSDNGRQWTTKTFPAQFSARAGYSSIVFNNKLWVIGGSGGGFSDDVWYGE